MVLTQAVAAALLGVTARRLRQLCNEPDPPPKNGDGQFDAVQFGAWLRVRAQAAVHQGPAGETYNYERERARLTKEQADKTELENGLLRAEIVRTELIEEHWSAMCANFRARLVALPNKLATLVADIAARRKFMTTAQTLVHEALGEVEQDALPDDVRKRRAREASRQRRGRAASAADPDAESMG